MPLPKPALDTRSFTQLTDEGRVLLPEVAPRWTDHNVSNTGIALIELLAWLCEMDLYRLDRTTDEAIRAYLRLVGVNLRPARIAQAVLTIDTGVELPLPAGLQVRAPGYSWNNGDDIVFQTLDAIVVSAAKLVRVVTGDEVDVGARNSTGNDPYLPFGPDPQSDDALYLGFDAPLATVGKRVNLYAWSPDPARDAQTLVRLLEEHEEIERERAETCPPTLRGHTPWWLHYQVRTTWEYFAVDGTWKALPDCNDHTRSLTLSGPISFAAPADHGPGGINLDPGDAGLHFIRCRIVKAGFECAGRIARIAINAVRAEHAADAETTLGVSRGHAQERYPVKSAPIVAGSTRMTLTVGAQVQNDWKEVPEWDLSGAHDRHYRLDTVRNAIEFGDGCRGVIAAAAAQLQLQFRFGAGPAGNLPSRSLELWLDNAHNLALVPGWPVLAPTLTLRQPFAAFGGEVAETLKAGVARAIEETRTPSVALTLEDFERIALSTPGVPIARARAIADRDPALPCFRASGDVTIVVIPDCRGPRPSPSPGMRAAVRRRLERHRSPAVLLHVISPAYYTTTVVATLHANADAERDALQAAAIVAIDAFLDPLRGGPDGAGWRVGRDIYRSEVLALLAALPGVASVTSLGLQGENDNEPRCGNLPLCDDQLPAPGRHRIAVVAAPALRIIDRSHPHECP